MLSLSSLIEFLLDMLRDEATKAEFERDPSGTLAARGLSEVTAQDVRDVQPMLADVGGVQRVSHDGGHSHTRWQDAGGRDDGGHSGARSGGEHHDVVREIHHVTHEYEVVRPQVTNVTQEYKTYNSFAEFHTTDNSIHASDGSTVVNNSYNQDNDGVDNKGGVIQNGSTVGGRDVVDSGNTTRQTDIDGSYNDSLEIEDSLNQSSSHSASNVGNTGADDEGAEDEGAPVTIAYSDPYGSGSDSYGGGTINGSYDVHASAGSVAPDDEPVGETV